MRTPEGYTLRKCLLDSVRKQLYVGVRDSDGAEILLKAYPKDPHGDKGRSRALQEFESLRALPPGVGPKALALEAVDSIPVLILEMIDGRPVRGPVATPAFLALALQASHQLALIHGAHIVHRGIRPQTLLHDPDKHTLRIVGFGRAAPLGAPAPSAHPEYALSEALFYIPPEQTGRIERGVDFRTDLYALGATFYELLSGRPPFDARDPLDLIQAHIARRPRTPTEVEPSVPGTLSRIVMKLLEKEPEDRYQTAEALRVDLEACLEQIERTGTIDDELVLGAADAPYRPLFRRRVYGRSEECAALAVAYERARSGSLELVVVRGAPGIGKSALVPELYRPLALDGGYLARGKLDLYRGHLPYAGFVSAIRSLVSQISRESESRRGAWREAFKTGLGRLDRVAVQLIPELSTLLGDLELPPPLDASAAQQRIGVTMRRLIVAAAQHSAPLVLFLDDVQWADAGSRYLLEEILHVARSTPLLVILSYRDNEVDARHPLKGLLERVTQSELPLEELALAPLASEPVYEMLADSLGHSAEVVRDLADAIIRGCGSNPLLLQQCIYHLHQIGCIWHDRANGWAWNADAAEHAVAAADPIGMMLARLQRLGGASRALVQLASCIGDEFDVDLLEELSGRERGEIESALYDLSDEGLIAPCEAGFRFVHDRIREAAQRLLADSERGQLHYRTARLLLDRQPDEAGGARCLEIADHLARAADCIPDEDRVAVALHHRDAALLALASGAFATASHYLSAAMTLLQDADWVDRPELAFELGFHAAVCAYQLRRFQDALDLLDRLERGSPSVFQQGLVAALRIRTFSECKPNSETLDLLYASMRRFGSSLPRDPSWLRTRLAIARVDLMLRGAPDSWPLRPMPPEVDPATQVVPMLCSAGSRARAAHSVRLSCLGSMEMLRFALLYGYRIAPGMLIAAFVSSRRGVLRSSRGLERYASATRHWLTRDRSTRGSTTGKFYLLSSTLPWLESKRQLVEPLREVAEALAESGEIEWETSAWLMRANYAALSGYPINAVLSYFDAVRVRGDMTPAQSPRALALPYRALHEPEGSISDSAEVYALIEHYAGLAQYLAPHWMLALSIFGEFSAVWQISELMSRTMFERFTMTAQTMDYLMLRGLAAAVLASRSRGLDRARLARTARSCERDLRRAARFGPDFVNMTALVAAERRRARGDARTAAELYARVAQQAEEQDWVHHAALALERKADALAALGESTAAQAELSRARALYEAWGAHAKVQQLAR